MISFSTLPLLSSLSSIASAGPLPEVSRELPFPEDLFTTTVALVQNTYCGEAHNYPGVKIGDNTLNKSIALPDDEQRVNVYTSESLGIVVAYQGTNQTNFDSIIHDVDFFYTAPDDVLNLDFFSFVFSGWQDQFKKTWEGVKSTIAGIINDNPDYKIQVIGHSQGAAIAQLGALAIRNEFGEESIAHVICYGPPRVGDASYASQFDDAFLGRYTGVTNGEDWVYSMPPQILGFQHPSGMVWINPGNSTSYYYYPDSEDPRGPDGTIPDYIDLQSIQSYPFLAFHDHEGIYMKSNLGGKNGLCPAQIGGF